MKCASLYIGEKKVETMMVRNSISFNKTKRNLSPQIIKYKNKSTTLYYNVVCFVDELLPNLVFAIENGLHDAVNELSLKFAIV